ncbi:hypothetical protein HGI47_16035 [Novosphingobium sp. ERN07]|uniref:hypothetical protein n=1 Tax=Novosphingobium sp. ERN07 TaxID=2726187 RepID=UPI0014571576|nr:hypothetical protein [Novosphingobium sp. ERN07]NLR72384.1 hypothetical protein [Novosphingobium sp. ERN07]
MKEEYIKLLLLNSIRRKEFVALTQTWLPESELSALFNGALVHSFSVLEVSLEQQYLDVVAQVIATLEDEGVILREGDEYTGKYFRIDHARKDFFIKRHKEQNPIAQRVEVLGPPSLVAAIKKIAQEDGLVAFAGADLGSGDSLETVANSGPGIPASDRIVYLNDNQTEEISAVADELISAIEPENSIDGDVDERSRILAQLNAAKELLRATSLRAFLMYETLFHALNLLIEKYRDKVLGQVAAKLLDLLIENVFGGGK